MIASGGDARKGQLARQIDRRSADVRIGNHDSGNQPVVALRAMPGTLLLRRRGCATRSRRRSVVPRGGIEPPTLRFSVACSTN
jgi:hypothetical protein